MTPEKFREQHGNGDYTTWTDDTFDAYFQLIADNATTIASRLQTGSDQKTPA